jgi:peptide/nickel transport system substrate-binding protein
MFGMIEQEPHRPRARSIVAILAAALVATACGTAAPSSSGGTSPAATGSTSAPAVSDPPAAGPTVTIGMADEPQALDPQAKDDGHMRAVVGNIFESLVDRAPDGTYVPVLADSWTQVDDTTWRFKLRPGVTFHNGEAFDADAVVYSVTRQIDTTFNSELLSYFTPITGATKVDDLTVDIKTDGFDPALVGRLYWLRIVAPDYTAASTPEILATKPVGTGPYTLESWERGQAVTLVVNPDYWGPAPSVTKLVFRPIKESSSRLQALGAGEIDVATALLPDQAAEAKNVLATPGFEYGFIRLNAKEGSPLESRELRQAMNYAIDKEALARDLFRGFAAVGNGQLVGAHVFGFDPNLQAYPFDQQKAKDLVAQSGYAGEEIEILTSQGRWPLTKEMSEAIAAMLGEVGIKASVKVLEFGAWLDAIFELENPPAAIHISETNEIGDPMRTIANYYTSDGQLSTWENTQADALVKQAAATNDQAERESLYQQVFALGREEAIVIFLLNTNDIYGISDRIAWEPRLDQFILGKEIVLK